MVFPSLSYTEACSHVNLPTLKERRAQICEKLFNDIQNEDHKLHHLLPSPHDRGGHKTRISTSQKYPLPKWRTKRYKNSFIPWCLYNFQDTY